MLQTGSTSFDVDGVTVLADHADRHQWWYLPTQVALAHRSDGSGDFSMIKYKPAVTDAGVRGGGFLMFRSVVELQRETRERILGKISAFVPEGEINLSPAPIDNGTVRCIALNLEGSGGAVAAPPPPGAFNAVTKILGASKPSLAGDNSAIFSAVLDQEGATIMQRAFEQGAAPVGVIYDLEYTALTPDIQVEIKADLARVYTHFSAGIAAQLYWVRAGIDAGFEKLREDRAIEINVINFTTEEDKQQKEKWALDFFKTEMLAKWFEPSLDLGKLKGPAQPEGLDAVLDRAKKLFGGGGGAQPGGGGGAQPGGGGGAQPGGGGAAALPKATLTVDSTTPAPLPAGRGISMNPAASGTAEVFKVSGPPGAIVTVRGQQSPPDASGNVRVNVAEGESIPVTVEWRSGGATTEETFPLYFTLDQPVEQGFAPNPANAVYASYLNNAPAPPDARFSQSTAPGRTAPPGGAAALQEWLDRLAPPKQVTITAHASFEGDASPEKTQYNQRLSERRLAIARGIVGSHATATTVQAKGFSRAQAAGRKGDEKDRVAEITGKTAAGAVDVTTIRATIARAKRAASPTPSGQGAAGQPSGGGQPAGGGQAAGAGGFQGPALVSFQLRFIHQDERKTLTFRYNSRKAVKHTFAPQGFIGLLVKELPPGRSYFVEIDLDDTFFRELEVDIATPADFTKIGMFAADVAIDYGDPADAQNHRHKEFRLTAADPGPKKFSTFLNATHDVDYRLGVQYHFNPDSGWIGEKLSYDIPVRTTTDRTLKIDPADTLGFLELRVFPNRIDAGIVEAIDVDLTYDDGATFQRHDILRVKPGDEAQLWRLRLSQPTARSWTAAFTHHLKDGTKRESPPTTSDATSLAVDDPFVSGIDIRVIPGFVPGSIREAFVDIHYEDPDNHYVRDERVELSGNAVDDVEKRIAILNKDIRNFSYRVVIITIDGQVDRRDLVETEDTFIPVQL